MKAKPLPSREFLLRRMAYDAESGVITWLPKDEGSEKDAARWNRRYAGSVAGRRHTKGHRVVMLDGQFYAAHRLIWRMVTGEDPGDSEVDHRDTNSGNDRWSNLRLADRSGNCSNVRCKKVSELGIKGVRQAPSGRFIARIYSEGARRVLGTFDTAADAHAAYMQAARAIRGEFARGG